MMRDLWRKAWRRMAVLAIAGVVSTSTVGTAFGQDPTIENLKQRLDRLEQQNRDLQQKLQAVGSPVTTESAGGVDARAIESIVGDYLERQAEAKKKDEKAGGAVAVGSDLSIKTTWKDGISFATPNNDFKFHVGGRVHFDAGWFSPEDADRANLPTYTDAMGFRRGRLRADGTAWEVINWVTEFDFANPDGSETLTDSNDDTITVINGARAGFTDVYVDVTQLPLLGTFRAGHFKVPFSLEELTSSRYMNTMERSIAHSAFVPSRRVGFMFTNTVGDQERATWAAGVFKADSAGNTSFDKGDGEYLYAARATALPYYEHEGRCLLHVGGALVHIHNNLNERDQPRYRSRMSLRLGSPFLVDSGSLGDVDDVNLFGGEVGANWGPVNFMAEAYGADNSRTTAGATDPFFWGYYAQVSYFLTGEHRPYNKKSGAWDRVRPLEQFYLVKAGADDEGRRALFGRGAWEVVARYAYLDLTDNGFGPIRASSSSRAGGTGVLQDVTLGVNWYWNPNFKFQVNYVHAWRENEASPLTRDGSVDGLGMRFAWDF